MLALKTVPRNEKKIKKRCSKAQLKAQFQNHIGPYLGMK